MRLTSDPLYREVTLTASAKQLAALADAIAGGEGFVESSPPEAGETLVGVEIRRTPGAGVLIVVDPSRRVLVISGGDRDGRAVLADDVRSVAAAEDGGHLHVDHFPDHPYVVEGSLSLVVESPHGGMPRP
ncbi:hypothetical protein ABZT03_36390 [Streptomyces sp. NPDC005574]|uniref:Imm32 family immunity protein n=1 Tax=Streptomyces sp. NPDC005574 TaxID=3156891 RepID=UPI0033A8F43A